MLEELDGSPVETRDEAGFSLAATRMFLCPWSERYTHRGTLLGPPGALYPYSDVFVARALQCRIEGYGRMAFDSGTGRATYEKAKLTVEYRTAKMGTPQETDIGLVSESLEATLEFLTLDHSPFRWGPTGDDDALLPDESPGIQIHGWNYELTRHGLPLIPPEADTLRGSINKFPWRTYITGTPPMVWPSETVLYSAASIGIEHSADGEQTLSLTMRFMQRSIASWNKFFRAKAYVATGSGNYDLAAAFKHMYRDGHIFLPYPVKDLAPLLG